MAADREFLFSPLTGALLKFNPETGASTCPLSGYVKSFAGECTSSPPFSLSLEHSVITDWSRAELEQHRIHTRSDMEVSRSTGHKGAHEGLHLQHGQDRCHTTSAQDLERRFGFQSVLKQQKHKAMDDAQNNRARATVSLAYAGVLVTPF